MQAPAVSAAIQSVVTPSVPTGVARATTGKAPVAEARAAVPDPAELKQAMEAANTALRQISTDLEFSLDPSTGKTVVRVIDNSTQQVIRQFPSEEMLAIARAIDRFQGLLLRQKA
jgi:flagellar protein FlaG